jgi:hypothetical protein
VNSYGPNGVVIAVFGMSSGAMVLRKVLNVRHGILVGYGACVEGAKVAAGSPRGVFFGC